MQTKLRGLTGRSMRPRPVVSVYALLLAGFLAADLAAGDPSHRDAPVIMAVLVAIGACGAVVSETFASRVSAMLDMSLALALLAVALVGPLAGLAVAAIPDMLRLVRHRTDAWNTGLLANVVSYAAEVAAGAGILLILPTRGQVSFAIALAVAGVGMAIVNYVFARLVLAVMRDHEPALALIRREFLALLPLELAMVGVAAACSLSVGIVGVLGLVGFAALVYVPQVGVAVLLRAPSVARLPIDAAAAAYRAALADELGLSRDDRRSIEQIDARVEGRPLHGDVDRRARVIKEAMMVRMCMSTRPAQAGFTASLDAQVVLTARRWAQLTARCTPALNHEEALRELCGGPLGHDAPQTLHAVARIVERERPLTEHVAGVPRLHRAPLPRRARQQLLPRTLARLAG